MELISYKYAIPYLIFLGYLFVLMFVEFRQINRQQSTKSVRILTIAGFLFFFALRGWVFADWHIYYPIYDGIPKLFDANFTSIFSPNIAGVQVEYGFRIYISIIKTIYEDYLFFQFVGSLIDIILLNIIVKRYSPKYYILPFILFCVFWGINLEINLLRNIKSILLFLLSLKYVAEKNAAKYFFINLIGFSFHASSILFFPLYFVLNKKIPAIVSWALFIVGNLLYVFGIAYLQPFLTAIAPFFSFSEKIRFVISNNLTNAAYPFTFGFFERFFTFCVLTTNYKKISENNDYARIFFNILIFYFVLLYYCFEFSELAARLSVLFVCSYWFLYSSLYTVLNRMYKQLFLVLLLSISVYKMAVAHHTYVYEYDNILFGIRSHQERDANYVKYGHPDKKK
jgi:hypothetical protein